MKRMTSTRIAHIVAMDLAIGDVLVSDNGNALGRVESIPDCTADGYVRFDLYEFFGAVFDGDDTTKTAYLDTRIVRIEIDRRVS